MEVEERWLDAYAVASGYCAGYFIERVAAIRVLSGKLWSEGKSAYAETSQELVLHIPKGLVRTNMQLPVSQVRAEIAMRFSQTFDELPPLFQTVCKVLAIATKTGFFMLPQEVLWLVLNDLITDGVERLFLFTVINEMVDMCLIKTDHEDDETLLAFQSPALADIAFDVSTPVQTESIATALIERLEPLSHRDFRVPLVLANLRIFIDRSGEKMNQSRISLWLQSYRQLMQSKLDEHQRNKWKEYIDEDVVTSGFVSQDLFGDDFSVDCPERKSVGKILPLLKIYSAPVSFGPMGHSLSVLTRNTFHEFGIFHGYSVERAATLRAATRSASQRYLQEMEIVEAFLSENEIPCDSNYLELERTMINRIAKPAASDSEVQSKAKSILDDFVPNFVTARLGRLYRLVEKLRSGPTPPVIQKADPAIRRAYESLQVCKNRSDCVQDALMIMATMNWKPKPVPEYLPIVHYQTIARIRSKVLICLNDTELFIYKHRQTHHDFEAFLLLTSLLNSSK